MGKLNYVLCVILVAAYLCGRYAFADSNEVGSPYELTCERLSGPVGVDSRRPRLGWKLPMGVRGQSAYEIEAGVWLSGKVLSERTLDVEWNGPDLKSSERISWRVRIWDERGNVSRWSEPAFFVMGVVRDSDWKAKWIGPNRLTRPDVDFADACWVKGSHTKGYFEWNGESGDCELIYSCTRPNKVYVNGKLFASSVGMVYDYRYPCFRDLRPFVRKGMNTVEFELPTNAFLKLEQVRPPDMVATLALIRLPGGRRFWSGPTWEGETIGKSQETSWGRELHCREEVVSPAFRKSFSVSGRVKSATLHVTGLGFYEAEINGRKVGEKVLDPAPTDYNKRVFYSSYVVEDLLRQGDNRLEIVLGHGWYDVRSMAVWNCEIAPWRDFPRCMGQLEVEYEDGHRESVVTDGSWEQVGSHTAYDCIREGEVVNSDRLFGPADRMSAECVPPPKGALKAETIPPAKIVRRMRPSVVRRAADGRWIVEFPENVTGWAAIRFHGLSRGDEVTIRYDESLDPEGGITLPMEMNVRWRKWDAYDRLIDVHYRYPASHGFAKKEAGLQIDHFISSGRAEERYEPRFTYKGFRYLIVDGLNAELGLQIADVEACLVRTAFGKTGEFRCSDESLTRLVEMFQNSYCANFTDGYPTDCPHREKLGWTGDGWIASEAGQYFFENTAAYCKWIQDIVDAQKPNGAICAVAPTCGWGYSEFNGPVFDAALAALPWNVYAYRNERKAIDIAYPAVRKYVLYENKRITADGLVANGLGDWNASRTEDMPSSDYVISSEYYHILKIAAQMAAVRGLTEDHGMFESMAERMRIAINRKFNRGGGVYDNGGQTAQALALTLGLVLEVDRDQAGRRLVRAVEDADFHVNLGLVGMKHVFRALSSVGRSDLAVRMLTNPTQPSPAYWIGKTSTLWEDWGIGMSKCHVMLGDFAAWACQYLAGIRLEGRVPAIPEPTEPGFSRFVIAPDFNCGLSWVDSKVDTPYGEIASTWKICDGEIAFNVTVPPGTSAKILLPNGDSKTVSAGVFSWKQRKDQNE